MITRTPGFTVRCPYGMVLSKSLCARQAPGSNASGTIDRGDYGAREAQRGVIHEQLTIPAAMAVSLVRPRTLRTPACRGGRVRTLAGADGKRACRQRRDRGRVLLVAPPHARIARTGRLDTARMGSGGCPGSGFSPSFPASSVHTFGLSCPLPSASVSAWVSVRSSFGKAFPVLGPGSTW